MNIYVIGPVTGIEDDNRAAFLAAKHALESEGYVVRIPHDYVFRASPHDQAMLTSINHLTWYSLKDGPGVIPVFQGVAMLDGWEQSDGARLEKQVAEACGIECRPWREWL